MVLLFPRPHPAGSPNRSVYKDCPGNSRALKFTVGLSIGYLDFYPSSRLNQSLDITSVPPGNYTFQMQVDPDNDIQETNENNNVLTRPITL